MKTPRAGTPKAPQRAPQQLLPRTDGGRAAAFEIMFVGPEIVTPIREGKVHLVNDFITLHQKDGMISMDESIRKLIEQELVSPQAALDKASEKDGMKSWLERRGLLAKEENRQSPAPL